MTDVYRSPCGTIELRLGRYQDVLADVEPDALITDPPFSATTHNGHDAINRGPRPATLPDSCVRASIPYAAFVEADVAQFCGTWSQATRGWVVIFSDDVLAGVWRRTLALGASPTKPLHSSRTGRYVFAPLPFVSPGSRFRATGDGPSSITTWIVVGRPRTTEYSRWGTLPGDYRYPPERGSHIGGKPLALMRAIVRDYSRPGDLVCDPCAGGATTLLAAAMEGRRAIGAEMDVNTYRKAVRRLQLGWTTQLPGMERRRAEQVSMEGWTGEKDPTG